MRSFYPGYQPKTEEDFNRLWADCTFAFDASALLDLYRLTPETREKLFTVLERAKERVWLPNQAGLEYYNNRTEVLRTGAASFGKIAQSAKDAANAFRKSLDLYRQYRWIDAERWTALLDKIATEIGELLDRESNPLCDYLNADPVEQRLTELFHERVGKPFVDMHEIYARADKRLELSIPPGFADVASKRDFHKYGDVVLWFQLLDFARTEHRNIIFITSDAKKDWWQLESGKTLGPRPELVQEMYAAGGVRFHMYAPHRFLEYAPKYLNLQEKAPSLQEAVEELQQVEAEKVAEWDRTQLQETVAQIAGMREQWQPSAEIVAQFAKMREQWQPSAEIVAQFAKMREQWQPSAEIVAQFAKMREQWQPSAEIVAQFAKMREQWQVIAEPAIKFREQLQAIAEPVIKFREQLQAITEPVIKCREQLQAIAEPNLELNEQLRKAVQSAIKVTANAPATDDQKRLLHEVKRGTEQHREHGEAADRATGQSSSNGGVAEKDKETQ